MAGARNRWTDYGGLLGWILDCLVECNCYNNPGGLRMGREVGRVLFHGWMCDWHVCGFRGIVNLEDLILWNTGLFIGSGGG